MQSKITQHTLHCPVPLTALDSAVEKTVQRPPLLSKMLRFDKSQTTETGLAIFEELGLEASDPSNTYTIFYRVKGAGAGDTLIESGFDDSFTAQMLANGTNGMLLFLKASDSDELSIVHAGARSPAGKKFANALIKEFKSSVSGLKVKGEHTTRVSV